MMPDRMASPVLEAQNQDALGASLERLVPGLLAGRKAVVAGVLARLEQTPDAPETVAVLDAAFVAARAHVLGVTGPPGVGKSTLLGALIAAARGRGDRVGVIAVDPSSRRSGGALLGDRTRLAVDPEDHGIFVRSMAARDRLGGLAELTLSAMVLMRAVYDLVIVETVGVGQSETDVVDIADSVLFCVQPGSGDSLQFMKAGIAEIPDLVAVTKADLGAPALKARADVEGALGLAAADPAGWQVPVLTVSARGGAPALAELMAALDAHRSYLTESVVPARTPTPTPTPTPAPRGASRLAAARQAQAERWLLESVRERYGREGVRRVRESSDAFLLSLAAGESPFGRLSRISRLFQQD